MKFVALPSMYRFQEASQEIADLDSAQFKRANGSAADRAVLAGSRGTLTRKGKKIKSRLLVPAKPILLPTLLLDTADCQVGKRRTRRKHVSFKRLQKIDL